MPKCNKRKNVRQSHIPHRNPSPIDQQLQQANQNDHVTIKQGPNFLNNNEEIQDFLEEDPIISGQELVLMSFATLGDSQREEAYEDLSNKLSVPLDTIRQVIEVWLDYNKHRRGIKIRGSFPNNDSGHKTIKKRIEFLKSTMSENYHIFVGEVGKWCPFDPDPNDIEAQEYAEEQLNTLMKEHRIANEKAKLQFAERKKQMAEKAMLEGTPEGQKLLLEQEEPIEIIQQRIESAKLVKAELLEKIADAERTQELAEQKLAYIQNNNTVEENNNVRVI